MHPHFGAGFPQFGAQHPILAWRETQSPGAVLGCPRRASRGFLQIQRLLFLEQGAWELRQRGEWSNLLQVLGCWGGTWPPLGWWLRPCREPRQPRGARQSLERSPLIIPSSGALSLGRGLQLQRAPGLEAPPRSAAPAEPRCHPGSRSGDRSTRTRPLRGPRLN